MRSRYPGAFRRPTISPLPFLFCRLAPRAEPVAQAWILLAAAQMVDAISGDQPGWSLTSSLTWSAAHLVLAMLAYGLLRLTAMDADGEWRSSLPIGRTNEHRRQLTGAMAALVVLLACYLVLTQPAVLAPLSGLAMIGRDWIRLVWQAIRW